jgi:hypothetical protein
LQGASGGVSTVAGNPKELALGIALMEEKYPTKKFIETAFSASELARTLSVGVTEIDSAGHRRLLVTVKATTEESLAYAKDQILTQDLEKWSIFVESFSVLLGLVIPVLAIGILVLRILDTKGDDANKLLLPTKDVFAACACVFAGLRVIGGGIWIAELRKDFAAKTELIAEMEKFHNAWASNLRDLKGAAKAEYEPEVFRIENNIAYYLLAEMIVGGLGCFVSVLFWVIPDWPHAVVAPLFLASGWLFYHGAYDALDQSRRALTALFYYHLFSIEHFVLRKKAPGISQGNLAQHFDDLHTTSKAVPWRPTGGVRSFLTDANGAAGSVPQFISSAILQQAENTIKEAAFAKGRSDDLGAAALPLPDSAPQDAAELGEAKEEE